MAFVRTKKIKGHVYAYLVVNAWTAQGSRQTSKKYLGRVFFMPKVSYSQSQATVPENKNEILTQVLLHTLNPYGFLHRNKTLRKGELIIDLAKYTVVQKNQRPAAIALNEGYLCTETLARILSYQKSETDEQTNQEGYTLAKYCIEAGLVVPQKCFVALYETSKRDKQDSA